VTAAFRRTIARDIGHKKPAERSAGFLFVAAGVLGAGGSLVRGLDRGGGSDVFLDAGSLAFQAAQVIQLGAAHLALALHLD